MEDNMKKMLLAIAVAAAAFGSVIIPTEAAPAPIQSGVTSNAGNVVLAYYYRGHHYPYRYHGHYYRYRHHGHYYRYRHGGHYYMYRYGGRYCNHRYYRHGRYYCR